MSAPGFFTADKKAAITNDLNSADTAQHVLEIYLTNVGCKAFKNTFP